MISFMFSLLIAVLICGLLWYLINWALNYFGAPQPIKVVVTILLLILFLYVVWSYLPANVTLPQHR